MARVLRQYPPNYHDICRTFPAVKRRPNAVFTYFPNIYYPAGLQLSMDLIAHEETHVRQQQTLEGGAAEWWERYLVDPKFRLDQELEAYQVQYRTAQVLNRGARRVLLNKIASDLSSPMYGNLLTKTEATEAIKNGTNR